MNVAPSGVTLPGVTHHRIAVNGVELHYVAAGTSVVSKLSISRIGVVVDASIQVQFLSPNGGQMGWTSTGHTDAATSSFTAMATGWHTIQLTGNLLPEAGIPFELDINYLGA